MAVNNNFPSPPENIDNASFWRLMKQSLKYAMRGKLNCTGEFTLRASQTTTVVDNILCNENSVVVPVPITSTAAAAQGSATGIWVVAGDKSFTVNHASTADANKSFKYVIIG